MLHEIYNKNYKVTFTPAITKALVKHCNMIELRDDMPEVLNTALLGVRKGYFYPADQQYLFDLFDVDMDDFRRDSHSADAVHAERNVSSNPYNLFVVWLVHLAKKSNLSTSAKYETMFTLMKLLHYKFFTSLVNQFFRYEVNQDTMQYTIDNLSKKYSIANKGTHTWKLLIEHRCESLISGDSIHEKTLKTFKPDEGGVLYLITDVQTRLRDTIKHIASEFYNNVEQERKLSTYSVLGETDDGQIELKNIEETLRTTIVNTSTAVLTVDKLLDRELIHLDCKFVKGIREDVLRKILLGLSNMATEQYHKHKNDEIIENHKGFTYLKGTTAFITWIIQKTYRRCVNDKVDIKNRLAVLNHAKNVYTNSRVNDPELLSIKHTAMLYIEQLSTLKKDQHKTSARLALIIYILLFSMRN